MPLKLASWRTVKRYLPATLFLVGGLTVMASGNDPSASLSPVLIAVGVFGLLPRSEDSHLSHRVAELERRSSPTLGVSSAGPSATKPS